MYVAAQGGEVAIECFARVPAGTAGVVEKDAVQTRVDNAPHALLLIFEPLGVRDVGNESQRVPAA